MDSKTYSSVFFILSHYTQDVVEWLEQRIDKGFYKHIYEKISKHYETITPISYYQQLADIIYKNTQQEGRVKEKAEDLISALCKMYSTRRKV